MKKYIAILLSLFIFFNISAIVSADSTVLDLYAGQHEFIGTVTVEQNGAELIVTYEVTVAGWCFTTTHLYVSDEPARHHAPGRFPYKHENLDCVTEDVFVITDIDSDVIYVAAHADAKFSSDNATLPNLDGDVTFTLDGQDGDSYFDNSIFGEISGDYQAWCVDLEHFISTGVTYDGTTHSTLEGFDPSLVDRPENMDLINYIINQDYIGQGYSVWEIQNAIWGLIDDLPPLLNNANVQAIMADALANGEGFTPECGDVFAVIVDPVGDEQITIVEYPVPCIGEGSNRGETAWAIGEDGIDFRRGWGDYFEISLSGTGDTGGVDTTVQDLTETTGIDSLGLASASSNANNNANSNGSVHANEHSKITICHVAGNSGNTVEIEVGESAEDAFTGRTCD